MAQLSQRLSAITSDRRKIHRRHVSQIQYAGCRVSSMQPIGFNDRPPGGHMEHGCGSVTAMSTSILRVTRTAIPLQCDVGMESSVVGEYQMLLGSLAGPCKGGGT
ncbi:predicted protein [Histoplasma capsulatum G186AR]|uniref:Uncharacterized protein n=1 Tax=Ajellomyces capsulatus (strain G186AR / H82 / ATCC MYA-2454 / RMSCC 2432) TaxID=447093 RepID=C0NYL5_AJECG|nr:uncharacterized protein HCBG_08245 [Histoplasma capsulatum G186AR]EEH03305.1 predicted protein [Histoplasma capsulatum G186AR]